MAKLKSKDAKISALNSLNKISRENLWEVKDKSLELQRERESHPIENSTAIEKTVVEGKQIVLKEENKENPKESQTVQAAITTRDEDRPIQDIDISLLDQAPDDWNRFPMLSEDRRAQLKLSIESSGLFNPILVWKQENGRYMILSGHNRVSIYKELYQDALDEKYNGSYEEGRDEIEKYSKIPCIVYETDELNARKAREIIIDTNFIQRGELPARLRAEILEARADIYKDQKNKKGKNIKEIAEELGIKKTAIYEDFQIIEKVAEPFRKRFYAGTLGRKAVLKLPLLSLELQQELYEKYGLEITEKQLLALKKGMTQEEIMHIFETEETIIDKQVRLKVPSNREQEFKKLHKYFIEKPDERFVEMIRAYLKDKE